MDRSRNTGEMWSPFLAPVMRSCMPHSVYSANVAGGPRWHHIIDCCSSQADLPRTPAPMSWRHSVVNELLTARSCLNWKKTWAASCCHVIPHVIIWRVKMNSVIRHRGWKDLNVSRQQLELINVDFGQLLSWSNPYHLCLLCIHLESVPAHPWFNFLRAADKPSNSCPRIRGSSAEMDLCHRVSFGIRVSLHVLLLDDIQQFCRVQKE